MNPVEKYLQSLPAPEMAELRRIRDIVMATVPEATETTSYGIPTFQYQGKYLIGFYGYKQHISLFPTSGPIEAMKSKLAGYKLSKGTIQFNLDKIIPEPVIRGLVLYRIDQIDKENN